MKLRKEHTCPLELIHDMLRGKWKTVILWQIYYREKTSLSQLKTDIKGISQKMLLQELNELLECNLVIKKKFQGYPLRVEYSLTSEKGLRVIDSLKIYQELGKNYLMELQSTKFS